MSSYSYDSECPRCGGDNFECVEDTCYGTSGVCLDCGFKYWRAEGQETLEQVNERREDAELPPLTVLREQKHEQEE